MSRLDTVYALGTDQPSNQYNIVFPLGIPGNTDFIPIGPDPKGNIGYRIDQPFDIPALTVGENELYFRGIKIVRPNRTEETDKHITFQFRLDGDLNVLDALYNWHKLVFDYANGLSMPGVFIRTLVMVQILNNEEPVWHIMLNSAWPKSVTVSQFDSSSNDPLRVSLELCFTNIEMREDPSVGVRKFKKAVGI